MSGALALAALLALQAADAPPSHLSVSLDRIRAGLARPAPLIIVVPEQGVHFRVEVKQRRYFPDLPPIDFGVGPSGSSPSRVPQVGTTPALVGVDLLAIGRGIAREIQRARHARGGREAQEEVAAALREFCATHDCSR
jgi:hypothetical protein